MVKGKQDPFKKVWESFWDFVEQSNVCDILANEENPG